MTQHDDIIVLDDVFCLFVRQVSDEDPLRQQGTPDIRVTGLPKVVHMSRLQGTCTEQFLGQGRDTELQQGSNKVRVAGPAFQGSGQSEQKVVADGEFGTVFMQAQIHHVVLLGCGNRCFHQEGRWQGRSCSPVRERLRIIEIRESAGRITVRKRFRALPRTGKVRSYGAWETA